MTRKRLGELLLQESLVDDEQLQSALDEQKNTGELIGDILVRKGFVTESDVARTISTQFSFPYISVPHYHIAPEIMELFPLETLEKHLFVPIDLFGNVLAVVVAGLLEQDIIDQIEQRTNCTAQVYVGMVSEVKQVIRDTFVPALRKRASSGGNGPRDARDTAAAVDITAPPEKDAPATDQTESDEPAEMEGLADVIEAAATVLEADEDNDGDTKSEEDAQSSRASEDEQVVEELEKQFKKFRFLEDDGQE